MKTANITIAINTQNAIKNSKELNDELGGTVTTIGDLRMVHKKLSEELESTPVGSEKFKELSQAVLDANTKLKNHELAIEALDNEKFASELKSVAGGLMDIAGGFTLIGVSGKNMESVVQTFAKVEGASKLVTGGIEAYSSGLKVVNSLIVRAGTAQAALSAAQASGAISSNLATVGMKALNVVMNANPVLLLVTGLATLVGIMYAFSNSTEDASKAQEELNQKMREANDENYKYSKGLKESEISLEGVKKQGYLNDLKYRLENSKSVNEKLNLIKLIEKEEIKLANIEAKKSLASNDISKKEKDNLKELAKQKRINNKLESDFSKLQDDINSKTNPNKKSIGELQFLQDLRKYRNQGLIIEESYNKAKLDAQNRYDQLILDGIDKREARYLSGLQSEIAQYEDFKDNIVASDNETTVSIINNLEKLDIKVANSGKLNETIENEKAIVVSDTENKIKIIRQNAQTARTKVLNEQKAEDKKLADERLANEKKLQESIIKLKQYSINLEDDTYSKTLAMINENTIKQILAIEVGLDDELNLKLEKYQENEKLLKETLENELKLVGDDEVKKEEIRQKYRDISTENFKKFSDNRKATINKAEIELREISSETANKTVLTQQESIVKLEEQNLNKYNKQKELARKLFEDTIKDLNLSEYQKEKLFGEFWKNTEKRLYGQNGVELSILEGLGNEKGTLIIEQNNLEKNEIIKKNNQIEKVIDATNQRINELEDEKNKATSQKVKEAYQEQIDQLKTNIENYQNLKKTNNAQLILNETETQEKILTIEEEYAKKKEEIEKKANQSKKEILLADLGDFMDRSQKFINAISGIYNQYISTIQSIEDVRNAEDQRTREKKYADETEALKTSLAERKITQEKYDEQVRLMEERKRNDELEAKRKAFYQSKKIQIAQAVMQGAQAVLSAYASGMAYPFIGPATGAVFAGIAGALSAVQIGVISSQQFTAARGGKVEGNGLSTVDSVDARLAPGEVVINSKSSSMFPTLLSEINKAGGGIPLAPQPIKSLSSYNGSSVFNQQSDIRAYIVQTDIDKASKEASRNRNNGLIKR